MKPLQTYFPFGPPIGHTELPKELINDFNKGCDDIVKDEKLSKSEDWSNYLVGQVEQEIKIPLDIINKWGKWFGAQVRDYITAYFNQLYIPEQNLIPSDKSVAAKAVSKMQINVQSAWYIRSFAGNFNPLHTHSDCELTCVGYLKVPDLSKERKKGGSKQKFTPAGSLEVLGSAGAFHSFFENDRIGFIPKVGNWYLFPADLRHLAYPFSCDGERRSFSININTNLFKGPTDK